MIGLTFARKILNMTTAELSDELKITRQAITCWETKTNGIPHKQFDNLERIFKLPSDLLKKEITDSDKAFILNHYSNLLKNNEIKMNN